MVDCRLTDVNLSAASNKKRKPGSFFFSSNPASFPASFFPSSPCSLGGDGEGLGFACSSSSNLRRPTAIYGGEM